MLEEAFKAIQEDAVTTQDDMNSLPIFSLVRCNSSGSHGAALQKLVPRKKTKLSSSPITPPVSVSTE